MDKKITAVSNEKPNGLDISSVKKTMEEVSNKPPKSELAKAAFMQGYREGLGKLAIMAPEKKRPLSVGEKTPESPAANSMVDAVVKDPKKNKTAKNVVNMVRELTTPKVQY
jgi:hypothetical protein